MPNRRLRCSVQSSPSPESFRRTARAQQAIEPSGRRRVAWPTAGRGDCGGTIVPRWSGPIGTRGVYYATRSEEHTSELQSLMRISYAVFFLKKKKKKNNNT